MTHGVEDTFLHLVDEHASSAPGGPIRLMVVDEHPLVRWALRQIAAEQSDILVVGEVSNAVDGVNQVFAFKPDVVTVDCSQPNNGGWQLVRDLRDNYPVLGIVVLTSSGTDDELFRALDTGASAFVSKAAPILEVMSAIRHSAFASGAFSAAGLGPALRRRRETAQRTTLSAREQQILLLLHDGMSVPAIAKELYVSLSTAKTYVARLYDKLSARNRAQALMTAVRLGLFADCRATTTEEMAAAVS
jgi:DNA-binding NarL/FixJ family response regulator